MILMVPRDDVLYPTLGPQVCDFIEQNMVFGPGDLKGQPLVLDDERRALVYRMYEVFPKGHSRAGRRRFKRVGISLPKGLAKTETAAIIAICELHPDAPVRCTGFTKKGEPIGGPVTDPYIPLIAFSQEQSEELAYSAMRVIIENSPIRDDFDLSNAERIVRRKGDGKAEALSSNPNSRDGARTTFSVADETHRWVHQRQKDAHTVLQTNITKRYGADGWMLDVTTAPEPGAGSVAESTMEYARAIDSGQVVDANLFFFHRQAGDDHDLTTVEGRRAAVIEASGAAAAWRDIDAIVGLWNDPKADAAYLERVYCNRLVKGSTQAFNIVRWKELAKPDYVPKPGSKIAVGFDGSQFNDSTAFVCEELETAYQWVAGAWERPAYLLKGKSWKVPSHEVDAKLHWLFETFEVVRMYADPPYWESWVSKWIGEFGKERVLEWYTNRRTQMTAALRAFETSIKEGTISHDGSAIYERHIGNSRRMDLTQVDEEGRPLYLIQKERPDSPNKIDVAMAGVLCHEAANDAIAAGALSDREPAFQMIVIGAGK